MRTKLILGFFIIGLLVLVGCRQQEQTAPVPAPPNAQQPLKVGKSTVVAAGKTPEEHVKDYFTAYKEKRYNDAYELQPAINKAKQTKEQFIQLRQGFPISDFNILPVRQQDGTQTVDAEYDIGQYGKWTSSWTFKKKGKNWIAEQYQVQQKQ